MKKFFIILLVLLFSASLLQAGSEPPKKESTKQNVLLIDDFSSGDTATSDKWWKFDNIKVADKSDEKGSYIIVSGQASDWYVGGMGTYVAKDAVDYSQIKITIYGKAESSGKLKIELVEDDIGSPDVDQDQKTFLPTKDDKFTSKEIPIDWSGWKTITIPVSELKLMNPGAGDGKWNPSTKNGHYGLLQFQIIVVANSAKGNVNFGIREIKLTQ
ncbi:MAG: hypothetical protein KKA19_08940 [Candidatus Margulisbacteria bacterium]|nr:hypothetical protein [Candidatus Margulisiibacteriota bacterium]